MFLVEQGRYTIQDRAEDLHEEIISIEDYRSMASF